MLYKEANTTLISLFYGNQMSGVNAYFSLDFAGESF
jgi:hypothetical protein